MGEDLCDLFRWACAGNQAAATDFNQRIGPMLGRYVLCLLCGNRHLAEEVVQDVLLALFKRELPPGVGTEQQFCAWTFTVARNIALRVRKSQGRAPLTGRMETVPEPSAEDDHLRNLQAAELKVLLARYQQRMDPIDWEILQLNAIERTPYSQIADALGLTEGAVRTRAFRTRRQLREWLIEDGYR